MTVPAAPSGNHPAAPANRRNHTPPQNSSRPVVNLLQRGLALVSLAVKLVLWPLLTFWKALWPTVDCTTTSSCDGLDAATGAKAAQQFVTYISQVYASLQAVAERVDAYHDNGGSSAVPTASASVLHHRRSHNDDTASASASPVASVLPDSAWSTTGFAAAERQAVNQSALLFVYLHAPLHADSHSFCQRLCQDDMVDWLSQPQVVAVGYSIQTAIGAHLAQVLNAQAFPFCALLQPQAVSASSNNNGPRKMVWLLRAEGPTLLKWSLPSHAQQQRHQQHGDRQSSLWLSHLQAALTRHETEMAGRLAQRLQREEDAALRRVQDEEFAAALEMDRARQAAAEQAAAAEQQAAQAAQQAAQAAEQAAQSELDAARALILPEPASDAVSVRFLLPSGTKLNRKFAPTQTIRDLKAYIKIHCHDEGLQEFTFETIGLFTNYPRRSLHEHDEWTLKEADLVPQAVLMVQDLEA